MMERFINSNPGLRSRFNRYIHFPDYTEDELFRIFEQMCSRYDYQLDPNAIEKLKNRIHKEIVSSGESFANARSVRNIFESTIIKQSTRISHETNTQNISLITCEDID